MEKDSGIVISDKLLHLCNKNNQQNKKYDVANSEYSELLHDMYESEYKVFDYPADCKKDSDKTYQRNKTQKRIALHINGKKASISWIQKYCKFFGCSADYMLGLIDCPTQKITDIKKTIGLSEVAAKRLIDNKDFHFVVNAMLEKNGIDYIVQALQADSFYSQIHKYISGHLYKTNKKNLVIKKEKNLQGVTLSDLDIYNSSLDSGYKSQQESFAIVCFDNLRTDKKLKSYFARQAKQRFEDQLKADT